MIDNGITWIASFPKSGSTWLRLVLACYLNNGLPMNFNLMPQQMTRSDNDMRDFFSISPYPIKLLSHAEMLLLRSAVLVKLIRQSNERPLLVKTHNAKATLDGINVIPDIITSKAVYVVRDPRDVAVSMSKWTGEDIDKTIDKMNDDRMIIHNDTEEGKNVFQFISSWSNNVMSWRNASFNVLVVKYERMHEDPMEVFASVIKHIGWELDEDKLKKSIDVVSFDNMKSFEESHGFKERPPTVDKFFRSGRSGCWVDVLSQEQSDRISDSHMDMMLELGYL